MPAFAGAGFVFQCQFRMLVSASLLVNCRAWVWGQFFQLRTTYLHVRVTEFCLLGMWLRLWISLTDELTSLNDAWEALRRLWSWPQRDLPCQMNAKVTISDCVSLCYGSDCYKPHVFPGGSELKQTHLPGLENSNLYSTVAQSMILAQRNIWYGLAECILWHVGKVMQNTRKDRAHW